MLIYDILIIPALSSFSFVQYLSVTRQPASSVLSVCISIKPKANRPDQAGENRMHYICSTSECSDNVIVTIVACRY